METCCKPDDGSEKEDQKKDADRQGKDQHLGEPVYLNLADFAGSSLIWNEPSQTGIGRQ